MEEGAYRRCSRWRRRRRGLGVLGGGGGVRRDGEGEGSASLTGAEIGGGGGGGRGAVEGSRLRGGARGGGPERKLAVAHWAWTNPDRSIKRTATILPGFNFRIARESET